MFKDKYVFPAIFSYDEDGISVSFPDLPGAYTCGDTDAEALRMAKECLALHIYGLERDGDDIPSPSRIIDIPTKQNESTVLVDIWMLPFRDQIANKSVKKTLTIPKWLDDLAVQQKVNFSYILQSALKDYLGLENKDKSRDD